MPKWILLPVEVKPRSFHGRLLLGCWAAEAGYDVIFGAKNALNRNLDRLPRGLYLEKSIEPKKAEWIKELVDKGYTVGCLDEEGLIYQSEATYARQRLSHDSLTQTTIFFAWGNAQASTVSKHYPTYSHKVAVTGNPRVDLWRPEFRTVYNMERDMLKDRFGRYILIPSNFAAYINANGPEFIIEQAWMYGNIRTETEEQELRESIAHRGRICDAFARAIPRIARTLPHHTVVVRPHPSDDHSYWYRIAETCDNIAVIYEGSVTPWILGSEAVIHNSCTTGLETFLLGIPAISYMPYQDARYDVHLPNAVSCVAEDLTSLEGLLEDAISRDTLAIPRDAYSHASRHIASLAGPFASERIIQAIHDLVLPADAIDQGCFTERRTLIPKRLRPLIKRIVGQEKMLSAKKGRRLSLSKEYLQQKFPPTSPEEVHHFVESLQMSTGFFQSVAIRELDRHLFYMGSVSSG